MHCFKCHVQVTSLFKDNYSIIIHHFALFCQDCHSFPPHYFHKWAEQSRCLWDCCRSWAMAYPTAGSRASVVLNRNWTTLGFLHSAVNEMQVSKVETCGGSVRESASFQHSLLAKALFWRSFRQEREGYMGWMMSSPFYKKSIPEANRPWKCLQCVRHFSLPAAELGEEVAPG